MHEIRYQAAAGSIFELDMTAIRGARLLAAFLSWSLGCLGAWFDTWKVSGYIYPRDYTLNFQALFAVQQLGH
jgi:hypothetical protein